MIATGNPYYEGRKTEIIDFEDPNFSCTNIEQFPVRLYAATGGLINGKTPFICGGYIGERARENFRRWLTPSGRF